jgi:glycosyltransferase involved in cell wall biosynthesis
MKTLVTAGLSDYKLSTKLVGILENPEVDKVYLVRKEPLREPRNRHNKIININPQFRVLKCSPFYELWRFLTMLHLARKSDIRVIVGIQLIIHGIQAGVIGFLTGRPSVLSVIGKDVHQYLATGLRRRFLSPIVKNMQCITVMGEQSKEIIRSLPVDEGRIFTLQNLHDRGRFFPVDVPKQWDIVFVGDLIPRKCVDHLVDAVAELSNKSISVAIVGDGSLRRSLEKKIVAMNLSGQFEFVGAVANVEDYLNKSRILVLPSKVEALPAVAVEAMYCGVPAVLSNVCDISTYFENGHGCLLYEHGDVKRLASHIEQLLGNPDYYDQMCQATQKWSERHCGDWEVATQRQVWQKILAVANERLALSC